MDEKKGDLTISPMINSVYLINLLFIAAMIFYGSNTFILFDLMRGLNWFISMKDDETFCWGGSESQNKLVGKKSLIIARCF